MSLRLININKIKDEALFFAGSIFRIYGVGMNVETIQEDYYDYMLVNLPWESEYLTLINVTLNNSKAGSVICSVKIDLNSGSKATKVKDIRSSIGEDNVYYVVPFEPVIKYE